jgi:hypothetical protein
VTLEDAWNDLHDSIPPGWFVGRQSEHPERGEWVMYAFDPSERPKVGKRSRQWTAQHPTQIGVLREMARCLSEITEGRTPR